MDSKAFIERHIIIGLVTSTSYLSQIRNLFETKYIESEAAKRLATWCLEYYDKYNKAPGENIEGIYFDKLKKGLPKDIAEEIEQEILPDLSEEYLRSDKFNVEYLIDQTGDYFDERSLELLNHQIEDLIDAGEIEQAKNLVNSYNSPQKDIDHDINLADEKSLKKVKKAFDESTKAILKYPGAVGELLNPHLIRNGFVAFLAPEKRGKSFMMLDMARRGVRQRLNVALFQAGDMSESQQIRRLGINLAKRSDQERYSGTQWEPVKDCIKNQADTCDLKIRESEFGLEGDDAPQTEEDARKGLTKNQLIDLHEFNPDYRACHNCLKYKNSNWGCAWLKKVNVGTPLTGAEAVKIFENYFVKNKRNLRISTHSNNTLTIDRIKSILNDWYRQGFVPDLIIIDYADLLVAKAKEYRHKQDEIWKDLRGLSEETHSLVVTATQADAKSYESGLLVLSNFSEDKRKYGHVTAMFGLNQDPAGREKEIGIMRINELVLREGDSAGIAHVLQNLKRGQPILTSYW